jgi:hypothetical protein
MLPYLTLTCISKNKRLRTNAVYHVRVVLNNKSQFGKIMSEFRFILYTRKMNLGVESDILTA